MNCIVTDKQTQCGHAFCTPSMGHFSKEQLFNKKTINLRKCTLINDFPEEHNTYLPMSIASQVDECPLLEGELLCTLSLVGVQSSGYT